METKTLFAVITKFSEQSNQFFRIKTKWVSETKIEVFVNEIASRQETTKDIYRVFLFEDYTDQKIF